MRCDGNLIAERLEQLAEQVCSADAGQRGNPRLKRDGGGDQFWAILAVSGECRAEHLRDCNGQHGGRDIRPIVYILIKRALPTVTAYQADRIDFKQKANGAPLRVRFWVENMRLAERQRERLNPTRVFVKQISQVRGWVVCSRDREQHSPGEYGTRLGVSHVLSALGDFSKTVGLGYSDHARQLIWLRVQNLSTVSLSRAFFAPNA